MRGLVHGDDIRDRRIVLYLMARREVIPAVGQHQLEYIPAIGSNLLCRAVSQRPARRYAAMERQATAETLD